MMATEDHLVPASKGGQGRDLENFIVSRTACNRLKTDFVPVPEIDPKSERRKYIAAVRAYIMKGRSDRLKEFMQVTHPSLTDYQ